MEVGGEVAYISIPSFGCPRARVLTPTAIAAVSAMIEVVYRRSNDSHPPQTGWAGIHPVPLTSVCCLGYKILGDGVSDANQNHPVSSLLTPNPTCLSSGIPGITNRTMGQRPPHPLLLPRGGLVSSVLVVP